MRRPTSLLVAVLSTAAIALGGCGGTADEPAVAPSGAGPDYPVTVGDLTLAEQPRKIVSLSATATEMLFAIGAGNQVTAVDSTSNYPPEAPKTELSAYQPNAEAIAGKTPDLVVISDDMNKLVDSLTKLKIPVYLAPAATTIDDTYRQLTELGTLTGHGDEATDVVERMKADIAKLTAEIPRRSTPLKYYWELDTNLYSVTSKTFVGSLLTLFGMTNVADPADADGAAGGYPQLSAEAIIGAAPDVIFLADTKCCQQSAATVKERAGWATIPAVTRNQVVALDDDIASRWGPRTVDLVRVIADAVAKVPA
ncbi:ABC transporter substrate-binding protein [Plantactinospora sp. GCM10030261]|uniref:ABC transporter substrate-binding protein n=1 Tax=Plantactinospora sp. GCM10030261 TaxID=3273420 RepID=UPI003623EFD9